MSVIFFQCFWSAKVETSELKDSNKITSIFEKCFRVAQQILDTLSRFETYNNIASKLHYYSKNGVEFGEFTDTFLERYTNSKEEVAILQPEKLSPEDKKRQINSQVFYDYCLQKLSS